MPSHSKLRSKEKERAREDKGNNGIKAQRSIASGGGGGVDGCEGNVLTQPRVSRG